MTGVESAGPPDLTDWRAGAPARGAGLVVAVRLGVDASVHLYGS
ncbi:hypothetical protein [Parafrankia sp. FMc2]